MITRTAAPAGAAVEALIEVGVLDELDAGQAHTDDISRAHPVWRVTLSDGRRLVVAMMYGLVHEGGPSYWDQAASLLDWGFALDRGASVGAL